MERLIQLSSYMRKDDSVSALPLSKNVKIHDHNEFFMGRLIQLSSYMRKDDSVSALPLSEIVKIHDYNDENVEVIVESMFKNNNVRQHICNVLTKSDYLIDPVNETTGSQYMKVWQFRSYISREVNDVLKPNSHLLVEKYLHSCEDAYYKTH